MMPSPRVRQPYRQGAIVVVELEDGRGFRRSFRPCIVIKANRLRINDQPRYVYPVVPLTLAELHFSDLSPRLPAREGGLPTRSTALCTFALTVDASRILTYVGALTEDEYEPVAQGLASAFGLRV